MHVFGRPVLGTKLGILLQLKGDVNTKEAIVEVAYFCYAHSSARQYLKEKEHYQQDLLIEFCSKHCKLAIKD